MMVEDDVKVEEQLQKGPKSTISTMVDQLRQIFPQRPEMELREVVESSTSIDDAIDSLLEKPPGENGKYYWFLVPRLSSRIILP